MNGPGRGRQQRLGVYAAAAAGFLLAALAVLDFLRTRAKANRPVSPTSSAADLRWDLIKLILTIIISLVIVGLVVKMALVARSESDTDSDREDTR